MRSPFRELLSPSPRIISLKRYTLRFLRERFSSHPARNCEGYVPGRDHQSDRCPSHKKGGSGTTAYPHRDVDLRSRKSRSDTHPAPAGSKRAWHAKMAAAWPPIADHGGPVVVEVDRAPPPSPLPIVVY